MADRFTKYENELYDEPTDDKSYYIDLRSNFRIVYHGHCPIPEDFVSGNDFDEITKII